MQGKQWYVADPVHQFVEYGAHEKVVKSLVATREFQRLRRTTHLGLASFVFPGAVHTRLSHCMGAAHLAAKLAESLKLESSYARTVVCAALLHDIGHGPFSHAFERALKPLLPKRRSHESWARLIIQERLSSVLQENDVDPKAVCALIAPETNDPHLPAYLHQIISSQLDVDRMDYLRRDAHFTGVPIGQVDLPYLIRNVVVVPHGSQQTLGLTAKGVSCYETFAFARHIMNKTVYFHKQVATFESMMEAFIRLAIRSDEQAGQVGVFAELTELVAGTDSQHAQIPMQLYLKLTEDQIWTAIEARAGRMDQLGQIASQLLERTPMPSYAITSDKCEILKTELTSKGFNETHYGLRLLPSGLYKQEGGEKVFVVDEKGGQPEHVTKYSSLVSAFRDQVEGEAVLVILDETVKENILRVAADANCLERAAIRGHSKPPVKVRNSEAPVAHSVRSGSG